MWNDFKEKAMVAILRKVLITLCIVILAGWLLHHSWQKRHIFYKNYSFSGLETINLSCFPKVQYNYGLLAWLRNNTPVAVSFFRRAVSKDPFYIDAWLKMVQAEAAMGHLGNAQSILRFTDNLTRSVFRWKWRQMLLAHELGMEDIFQRNANYILSKRQMLRNTFQMLDIHYKGSISDTLNALGKDNLVPYLEWLMGWGRISDTYMVWEEIDRQHMKTRKIILKYTHFLIGKKDIMKAQAIWQKETGTIGMMNKGFEEEIIRIGFDWRYEGNRNWEIKRVKSPVYEGSYALEIKFAGQKNISFHHLYQIVPVEPLRSYCLTYKWKSKGITTDQGPFIEIYCYDKGRLHCKGHMIKGTNDWTDEAIEFTTPEECHAVVVRVRRLPSGRFDCNIAGQVWLDNFCLELLNGE